MLICKYYVIDVKNFVTFTQLHVCCQTLETRIGMTALFCFRSITGDQEDQQTSDDSVWKQHESLALSQLVQDRLHRLQVHTEQWAPAEIFPEGAKSPTL